MEGGSFSKCGSRVGAAHILRNNSCRDGGRYLFKTGLSPWRSAHSSELFATVTGMDGCGSRLGAAHIRAHVKRIFPSSLAKKPQSPNAREHDKTIPNTSPFCKRFDITTFNRPSVFQYKYCRCSARAHALKSSETRLMFAISSK